MDQVVLFGLGIAAGVVNAAAGGGSLLTFPGLVAMGIDPEIASVTNAIAVYPANVAALHAYRTEIIGERKSLKGSIIMSFVGGVVGAVLLLFSEPTLMKAIAPWMMLGATIAYISAPILIARLGATGVNGTLPQPVAVILAIYGGYFGAGLGIMLMAVLAFCGLQDPHRANARKNLLVAIMSGPAVVLFVSFAPVAWHEAVILLGATTVGALGGAPLLKHIPARILRAIVAMAAVVLTISAFDSV